MSGELTFFRSFHGHRSLVTSLIFTSYEDNLQILSASLEGQLLLWDLKSGHISREISIPLARNVLKILSLNHGSGHGAMALLIQGQSIQSSELTKKKHQTQNFSVLVCPSLTSLVEVSLYELNSVFNQVKIHCFLFAFRVKS